MVMEVEASSRLTVNGRDISFINESELPTTEIAGHASMREVAAQLSRWVDNARSAGGRTSMFDRGAYTPPDNPYDEMRAARHAMRYDSIVAGVAETTEGFAFQGVKWEGEDADESDIFNQMARDLNLDAVVRRMWREEFSTAQFVAAKLWGWKEYVVRGRTKAGVARKKKYRIWCPQNVRILDSLKVVPAGLGPIGGETLCWQATSAEVGTYNDAVSGDKIDPLMLTFFQGVYSPDYDESNELTRIGVNPRPIFHSDHALVD